MSDSPGSPPTADSRSVPWRAILGYGIMVAACIGAFFVIRAFGETLQTSTSGLVASHPAGDTSKQGDALLHVLIALAAVILVGRILSSVFTFFGQPPVI